jgi:hypothetical protein
MFASQRSASSVILAALDVAIALKNAPVCVVSGFQSPLERESLKFLLKGSVPLVVCPARSAVGMRIPAEFKKPMAEGRLTIRSFIDEKAPADSQPSIERPTSRSIGTTARTLSPRTLPKRPTTDLAEQRNRFACSISDAVLILHASPGGKLERLASELLAAGKHVWTLDDPANASLIAGGARPLNPKSGIECLFPLDARKYKVS